MSLLSCLLAVPTSRSSYNFFLPAFRNKKGANLFFCVFGGILLGKFVCFDFEGLLLNDFAFVFTCPAVKDR